ncbi:Uu.00g022650.m01.CDS01 [Anthostomella pinea]|uniref:Uu.00g022650.m01.CDS01 n=1 Tax=Anthostomella pinea TaxID=933095 RepID=A0AAI8VZW8_9PEZI|nr:Uu.00g022650.m01.CDS01 [Anthostomella pinea]
MKFSIAAVALAAVVSAQSWSDIPACATPCIDDAIASTTTCAADDYACICSNEDVIEPAAEDCVVTACGEDVAVGEVEPAVAAFCGSL